MSGFTDELIRDLDQNEEDAKRAGISRLAVLKEAIQGVTDAPITFVVVVFMVFPLTFVFTTYGWVTSNTKIPQIEEGMFQIFEVRGISVEELNLNDPILSEVIEDVETNFLELVEMAQQDGMVYYSRKPEHKFFVVDEYWNVVHYYVNRRLHLAYNDRGFDGMLSSVTGIATLLLTIVTYKLYKDKYREMTRS